MIDSLKRDIPDLRKLTDERVLLESPDVHFLVLKVLELTKDSDPVDALHDIELVHGVLLGRLKRHMDRFDKRYGPKDAQTLRADTLK